jgi:hypothetical protein
VLAALAACGHPVARSEGSTDRRVANLHAFARLYGVVRWFHPSDAAAVIDWDRFAVEGGRRVVDATTPEQLSGRLRDVFASVAPSVQIAGDGDGLAAGPVEARVEGLDVVAWQHRGYGDSTVSAGYASKRLHRDLVQVVPGAFYVALSRSVDAAPLRGAEVRLRGKLRAARHGHARIWMREDRGDTRGFFDNMQSRPVISDAWTEGEVGGTVSPEATRIVFGVLMLGAGTTWYDDLELAVRRPGETWAPAPVLHAGFDTAEEIADWHPGTDGMRDAKLEGWRVTVDPERPAAGAAALRVEPVTRVVTEELFGPAPRVGDVADIELGGGLRARVPLALHARGAQTIGDDPAAARRTQAGPMTRAPGYDPSVGIGDVIVFWNVFEHFWPYWNTVRVDWSASLDRALARALGDRSTAQHVATLERMIADAPDAHTRVICPGEALANPPFALDWVEDQVVVTASADPRVQRGDVLLAIDGQPVARLLEAEMALVSGSPQWRRVRGLQRLGRGPRGSTFALRWQRAGAVQDATIARVETQLAEEPGRPAIERLADGVYVVDLARARMPEIQAELDHLASAPGVVFNLRDRPQDNYEVLSHLTTRLDRTTAWEAIPLIIRPDSGSSPAAWEETSGFNMFPLRVLQPHIAGRVAFLIGPRAVSETESGAEMVAHYHLGALVGAATAGTNGDIAEIAGPTGCTSWFTGRRVTKMDGHQHHLVGVQPTIAASRTIAGVAAGRDEVLERALAYVREAR